MKSIVQERGSVAFPQHTGERIYMREFRKSDGLPFDLERWQPTVDSMLDGIDTDGPIYLMVDQGVVRAGHTHRRPGLHIDGYWVPAKQAHNGSGGGHSSTPSRDSGGHRGYRGHSSTPPARDPGSHRGSGRHASGSHGGWINAKFEEHEGLILASSITAARAFDGEFEGAPNDGGDCSHIDTKAMREVMLSAGRIYAGNVTMLHESLPVSFDCLRTVVRLNVPGWHP
jgi:hypothetical protein